MRHVQFWLGCGAMLLVAVALLLVGSRPMPHAPTLQDPEVFSTVFVEIEEFDEWTPPLGVFEPYNMVRDSGLYKAPAPPAELTPAEAKEYALGYRAGWEDEADDVVFFFPAGATELWPMYVPACMWTHDRPEAFQRGYRAGREQAERDRETFRLNIEKQLRFDHWATFRVPGTDTEIAVGLARDRAGNRRELVLMSEGRIRRRCPLHPDPGGRSLANLYRRADGNYLLIDMNGRWVQVSPKRLTLTHLGMHGKEQPKADYIGRFAFRNDGKRFRFRRADGIPLRPYCSK